VLIVSGITTKKTDAPFTVTVAAAQGSPDGGATGTPGGSGGKPGGGGCAMSRSNDGAGDATSAALVGLAIAALGLTKRRARKGGNECELR
jgi:hypothetical protein